MTMKHKDMTVPCDNGLINIRVGAVIMKDGRFLMVGNERADYLYSVGGRVRFGETAEEAVRVAVRKYADALRAGGFINAAVADRRAGRVLRSE